MKLTVIVDNNTYIDQYYIGEPGACYYIETKDKKILLDTGYSDVLIQNAQLMNIDLNNLTDLALSHGHDDHTKGLKFLDESGYLKNINIIAHPDCLKEKSYDEKSIGVPFTKEALAKKTNLILTKKPYFITDKLIFLGEIPRKMDYEAKKPIGKQKENNILQDDYLLDDTALVYKGEEGLFIITACSHSGICNIVSYAMKISGDSRISGIIGGFHLFEIDEQVEKTIDYLSELNIKNFYPCHCVSLKVKCKLMEKLDVQEVGVGLKLEIK